MKYFSCIFLIIFISIYTLHSQSRAELEEKRKKTIEDIAYIDNLIKTTSKEKDESMKSLSIVNKRLLLRENVISGMSQEINLLNYRIELNNTAIEMMENDLLRLKMEYSEVIRKSYRAKKGYPDIVYILSAKDFNQGYKRFKYLQQVAQYRRKESELIVELKEQIVNSRLKLRDDLFKLSDLKSKEEIQKNLLQNEKKGKQDLIKRLSKKEKQLSKELQDKKKVAQKIELEINRLIEEERKRAAQKTLSEGDKLLGVNFSENKGKLPWPVEQGVITSHFGIQKHPEFKYLTEDNIGIEITSSGKINARAIFNGVVAKVFSIPGANMTVILRHGNYLSVYSNLVNVKVKPGENVNTRQTIGEVFNDQKGNNAVLKFMIFENERKYLDPEIWIVKN